MAEERLDDASGTAVASINVDGPEFTIRYSGLQLRGAAWSAYTSKPRLFADPSGGERWIFGENYLPVTADLSNTIPDRCTIRRVAVRVVRGAGAPAMSASVVNNYINYGSAASSSSAAGGEEDLVMPMSRVLPVGSVVIATVSGSGPNTAVRWVDVTATCPEGTYYVDTPPVLNDGFTQHAAFIDAANMSSEINSNGVRPQFLQYIGGSEWFFSSPDTIVHSTLNVSVTCVTLAIDVHFGQRDATTTLHAEAFGGAGRFLSEHLSGQNDTVRRIMVNRSVAPYDAPSPSMLFTGSGHALYGIHVFFACPDD